MRFEELRKNWNRFGSTDPMWAVLTVPSKRRGKWTPSEFFETGKAEIAAAMDRLHSLGLAPNKDGRALDFGCGVGRLTQALGDNFQNVVGVDIADSMIEEARKFNRHSERCTYLVNNRPDLSQFESRSFDFVYSHIVLQHMRPEYSTRYVAEFMRILKAGGIAVFDIPVENIERFHPSFRNHVATIVHNTVNFATKPITGKPYFPKMEMYPVAKSRIDQIVGEEGGRIIDTQDDRSCGTGWRGYSYVVAK